MAVYKEPNILFLRGITPEDLKSDDSIFDTKFTECINGIEESKNVTAPKHFTSLPTKFTTWDRWPTSTNLKCWTCDRNFTTVPIFIVDDYSINTENQRVITPVGNFCSDNCAQSYIDKNYTRNQHDNKTRYQLMMRRERTGDNTVVIKPSPSKTTMKQYCGDHGITQTEYEKKIEKLNSDFNLTQYKMEHFKINSGRE